MEAPKRLNYPYLITRDTCTSRENLEVFSFSPSDGCPATATCLASTQDLRSRRVSSASKHLGGSDPGGQTTPLGGCTGPGSLTAPPGRFNWPGWQHLLVESSASILWLNRIIQWFSGEPLQTPWTRCSLRQSPLMTRLSRSLGSTLVLRLNQETVHDSVPLFLPPCGPHMTLLATGSLEPSLLVFSTTGGLTDDDLSRLFFTCTNTSQAATCTCNISQELVPTTLSITHHTRKRPSTSPRNTHGP
jgi:hypothetical protein